MWGVNICGQIGDGTKDKKLKPTPIEGIDGRVTQVLCKGNNSGALTEDGKFYRWGQEWTATRMPDVLVPRLVPIGHKITQVSFGLYHIGITTEDGMLYMMGHNGDSQLGIRGHEKLEVPTHLPIDGKVIQVSFTPSTSGVVTEDGKLYRWGYNYHGNLGRNITPYIRVPTLILEKQVDESIRLAD